MESVLIESRVPVARIGLLHRALMPLVWLKDMLSRLHVWLLSMLWDELIRGKTAGDNAANIVAAAAFLGLSLFVFHYQETIDYCILVLCVVWGLDYAWVRWGHDAAPRGAKITLSLNGDRICWRRSAASADEQVVTLNRDELGGVVINRLRVERGLLEAVWRTEWQVYLARRGQRDEPLLVSVEPKLSNAYQAAMRLGDALALPISFVGESPKAASAPTQAPSQPPSQSPSSGRQEHPVTTISTRVSVTALRRLIGSVLAESGLLLFLLILTAVMTWFGEIVHFYVVPLLGLGATTMRINLSLGGLWGIFRPDVDWKDTVEISIAIAVVLLTVLRYCQRHTLRFNEMAIEHFRGRRRKATLRRSHVGRLHYIAAPYPLLVLSDGNEVVAIDLPARRDDFAAFVGDVRRHLDR